MDPLTAQFNRPEFGFLDLLFPWIAPIALAGFIAAWIVVTIMEDIGLTRRVWHLPLFFVALTVLFSCGIGALLFP
jgi:tetrahydromethanopterin S-methyltransferase subunit E